MNDAMQNELTRHDNWNRRFLCAVFAAFGIPGSYLDVGCGTGAMVELAHKLGIKSYGLDIILRSDEWFIGHDLRNKFELAGKFDLICCIEVLEHIEQRYEDNVLQSIAQHTGQNGLLIFSAAGPGQDGINHVNCQLGSYWRTKLHDLGFNYRHDFTTRMQMAANLIPAPSRDWWIGNMQVFEK